MLTSEVGLQEDQPDGPKGTKGAVGVVGMSPLLLEAMAMLNRQEPASSSQHTFFFFTI